MEWCEDISWVYLLSVNRANGLSRSLKLKLFLRHISCAFSEHKTATCGQNMLRIKSLSSTQAIFTGLADINQNDRHTKYGRIRDDIVPATEGVTARSSQRGRLQTYNSQVTDFNCFG